jgi:hypothetical protein
LISSVRCSPRAPNHGLHDIWYIQSTHCCDNNSVSPEGSATQARWSEAEVERAEISAIRIENVKDRPVVTHVHLDLYEDMSVIQHDYLLHDGPNQIDLMALKPDFGEAAVDQVSLGRTELL